jgi:ATP-dependent DNA helicase RecG
MPGPLDTRLLTALGARVAPLFEKAFGLETVGDLLAHYPRRYAVRGDLTPLDELRIGDTVVVVAEVRSINSRQMRQRHGELIEVVITDGTGTLQLTFFSRKATYGLKPGMRGIFAGKVGLYRNTRQLAHPAYEAFPDDLDAHSEEARAWAEAPMPIYPATSSLDGTKIRGVIQAQVDALPPLDDPVPEEVRVARDLLDFRDALRGIHHPRVEADWRAAQETLRFHEALVLQTSLLRQRAQYRSRRTAERRPGRLSAEFADRMPFTLTDDQAAVGMAIEHDLASGIPMNRLVQGEVGSGKTLVALRAMLAVADSGGQSAFLAPTEVLAGQHLRSIVQTLGPDLAARLRPTLITGQLPVADRRKALLASASGGASIVVGTHALLGDQVQFADLGLVVVDEQHRFGVDQREALRLKGGSADGGGPHVLVLTATPIPRTVAMTVFGDLDVSTIAQLPAGRSPITSHVVGLSEHPGWIARVWERLAEELEKGHQGFVVCPAIDAKTLEEADPDAEAPEEGAPPPAAVLSVIEELRRHPKLAGRRLEVLHGRMSADEKDATMRAFAAGDIDVLVATTVIEVGVDVPNASTMVVLDADRFGIAQLHQLRGRVGRGSVPGLCLFVTHADPVSLARDRVDAVAATTDGFELAQVDLELRREGDVLGGSQSGGRSSLKLLRVSRDGKLIEDAREVAEKILEGDPGLRLHEALREAIERRLDETERTFLGKS